MRNTKQSTKVALLVLILTAGLLAINPVNAADPVNPVLKQQLLFENVVELPSKQINAKIKRVTFPEGFLTPWHTHSGPGPRYVLKGTLKISEGGQTNTYSAGEVFWESGIRMSAENVGEGEAEVVIFELAPAK